MSSSTKQKNHRRIRLALALFAAAGAVAQSTAPAFEAASVKAADLAARKGVDFRLTPGRLVATEITLELLVNQAYGVNRLQIAGGPSWFKTEMFDINATAQGAPSRDQMMLMLQNLLQDRFQLKLHRESREGKVYALAVARNGPKLEKAIADESSYIGLFRYDAPERPSLTYVLAGKNSTIAQLIDRLKGQLRTPAIADNTGLQGPFKFRLEFTPDDPQAAGPSLFVALQEQLGLKLESGKGPVEMLVIDHAERPAGN